MTRTPVIAATALAATLGLGACQATGPDLAAKFAQLSADMATANPTPDATVNTSTGTATYDGVANIVTNSGGNVNGYLGAMSVDVNFSGNSLSGKINNFHDYTSSGPAGKLGDPVGGKLTISGLLTGDNTSSIGSGITGTAKGSVDGFALDMDMTGSLYGDNAEWLALWFSDMSSNIGVAIGAR